MRLITLKHPLFLALFVAPTAFATAVGDCADIVAATIDELRPGVGGRCDASQEPLVRRAAAAADSV